MTMDKDASSPLTFTRGSALASASFFSTICGYLLALSTFTFDLVVPSVFIWAAVTGVILNFSPGLGARKALIDCVAVATAFAASPILFSTLRGVLAYHAGTLPNLTLTFGYEVLKFNELDLLRNFLSAGKWFLVLFVIVFPLLVLGTFAASALVLLMKRIFSFGPKNIERTRTILLKIGTLIALIASGVTLVASLSRDRVMIEELPNRGPLDPGKYQGVLTITGPDRGRLLGAFFPNTGLKDGFSVIIEPEILRDVIDAKTLARLKQHKCPGDYYSHNAACFETTFETDMVIDVGQTFLFKQSYYAVVKSVERAKKTE